MKKSGCLAAVILVSIATTLSASNAIAQQIWFGPRSEQPHFQAAPDWRELFQSGAPWKEVAQNVTVFRLDEGFLEGDSVSEIAPVVSDLNQRGIGIAMVIQALAYTSPEDCGHGSEGYHYPKEGSVAAENLRRSGGTLHYLMMDGPLWFGRYEKKPSACHGSVEDTVRRAALNVAEVLKVFPNAELSDIEGVPALTLVPNWRAEYVAFKRQLESTLGHPISAISYDVNWDDPRWPDGMRAITEFARSLGMRVGVVYNGTVRDRSDREWLDHAIHNFTEVQQLYHIIPDRAIFASWNNYPSHMLPDTDDTSMTWLVGRYIQFRQGKR